MANTNRYDFTVISGITFTKTLTWFDQYSNPINLTGYTGVLQIRDQNNHIGNLLGTATITFPTPTTSGQVTFTIPSATSLSWTFNLGYYDLVLTDPSGNTYQLIYGTVKVIPSVSV